MFQLRAIGLIAAVLIIFNSASCPSRREEMRPVGPEVKANQVIFFRRGITNEQVEGFLREVLSTPDHRGTGYDLRKGISEYSRVQPPVQGHEGVAISFFSSASNQQRDEIKHDVLSSPIVYIVLENVAPANVRIIEPPPDALKQPRDPPK